MLIGYAVDMDFYREIIAGVLMLVISVDTWLNTTYRIRNNGSPVWSYIIARLKDSYTSISPIISLSSKQSNGQFVFLLPETTDFSENKSYSSLSSGTFPTTEPQNQPVSQGGFSFLHFPKVLYSIVAVVLTILSFFRHLLEKYSRFSFVLVLLFAFAGRGNAQSPQTFTTNDTFTVPAGVTSITVECWGAGGGGSSIPTIDVRGGGGGGGAFASSSVAVLPGNSYTIVVGAAGTAGNAGGNSSFDGTAIVASGGSGGTNNSTTGGLGGTILSSTGSTKYAGGNGANGDVTANYSGGGGGGAGNGGGGGGGNASGSTAGAAGTGTFGGAGGTGVSGSSDGNSGNNFGGGGSGAVTNDATNRNGGAGASGQVIVTWTCPTDAGVLSGIQNICISGGISNFSSTVSGGTWYSSNSSIATIDNTGLITAIAGGGGGTVTMTYDVSSPGCTVTPATRTLTVYTLPTVEIGPSIPDVCQGSTSVALGGSTSGGATSAVWSDGAAGGSFSNNGGSTPSTTTWTPLPGYTGTATLTLTTTGGACTQVSDSKPIKVNASPTLTGASQAATVCAGSSAIINLTGLLASSTSTVDYKINDVAQAAVSGVFANGSGAASFTSAALTAANNGQILQITGITTTSITPNCNKTFTQDVTLTVDPTTIGGTVSSDQTICFGSSPADLTLSGKTGAVIRWEKSSDAVFTTPVTIAGTSTTLTGATIGNLTANTWFRAVVQSGVCSSANSGFILVTVTPTVIINAFSPATSTRCQGSGTVTTTTTASNSTGITYSLDAASLAGGNTIVAATGEVTYSAGWSGTTTITVSAAGCNGPATATHSVTVNPIPDATAIPTSQTICSGTAPSIALTSTVSGTTFAWTVVESGVTGASAGSGSTIVQTLTATGTTAGTATYSITPTANGCAGTPISIVITVNPTPVATATPTSQTICSGSAPSIALTSTVAGTTFAWTVVESGVTGASAGSGSTIVQTLTATGTTAGTATYSITPTANGCAGTLISVVITVNPTPVATATPTSQIICSGTATSIVLTSNVTGTTFAWTIADFPVGSITGASASSGGSIAQTLVNTGAVPATLTYTITPTANGCSGVAVTVVITVNPKPTLSSSLTPPAICSNTAFSYSPTSATSGTTFSWSRAPILGITPASGSGTDNPNETLSNLTAAAINVTYIYTLTANGCTNTQNVAVDVLPTLTLSSSPSPPAVCSNTPFSYPATSAIPGVTFSWSRAAVAGISNPASLNVAGNTISETLINTTAANVIVPYIYTLTVGTCTNTQTVNVTVKPSPELSSTLAPAAICSNTAFVYNQASATTGTTFSWIRSSIAGISNAAAAGTNGVNETLINTTANPIAVTYAYTLRAAGCQNIQNVVVTVNPTPTLTSSLAPAGICTNSSFSYSPTSATSGTTFAWNRALFAGISNAAASGNDNPNETLINTTSGPVSVIYVYTLTANGCIHTQNVTVVVNPLPVITVTPASPTICDGTSTTLTASGASTYIWSPATGLSATTGATVTANPTVTTTYTVAGTDVNGCVSSTTVLVTVISKPTVTVSPASVSICNGGNTTLTAGGAATYSWSPATGLSATTGTSVTASPSVTTTYTVTGTDTNGCTNTATATVTVNPLPTITITPGSASICQGASTSLTASGAVSYSWSPDEEISSTSGATVTVSPPTTKTYIVTGTDANGCSNTQTVVITVKPLPVLTSTNPPTICSYQVFNYAPISSVLPASYTWNRAPVTGILPATSSGSGNISEALTNTTAAPIGVTYIYTITANGCTNVQNVSIVVIPAPTVNAYANTANPLTICEGGSVTLTSSSSLVALTPNLLPSGFAGWTASRGTSPAPSNGTIADADWTLRSDGYSYGGTTFDSPDGQFYISNSRDQGGTGNTHTVLTSPAINISGYTTLSLSFYHYYRDGSNDNTYVETSTDGFTWFTHSPPSSYNATQGTSSSFANSATTPAPISLNGYVGNPTLYIRFRYRSTNPNNSYYWAIGRVSVIGTSANNPVISWSSVPAGYSSSVANPPSAVSLAVTTTYIVSYTDPTADPGTFCPGTGSVTVTVNPKPVMTSANSATICSGETVSIPLTADIPSTFTWIAASNANVTGESITSQSTSTLSNTLTNATSAVQTVVYTVTPTSNTGACIGTSQTVNVIVNPIPSVNQPANQALCANSNTAAITFTGSAVAGTTYTWTNDTPSIGLAASGTGNIPSFTALNAGVTAVTATIVVTPVANGCTGPTKTFTITVNPTPTPTITADYCSAQPKIKLTATGGGTYLWSTGETTSTILVDIAANYSVLVTSGGCSASAFLGVANELVVNGSFTSGNTGFTSNYTYFPDVGGNTELVDDSGTRGYGVGVNGQNYHSNFWGIDHTQNVTGAKNFMLVNGHGTITTWQETVTVAPNTDYYFSAWAMSLNAVPPYARLQFEVNGVPVGTIAALGAGPNTTAQANANNYWTRFYSDPKWNSGALSGPITIRIINLEFALNGNDFALDDISFGTLDPAPATIVLGSTIAVCEESSLNLFANVTGGKAPFTYSWTGPNGFTSSLKDPVVPNMSLAKAGRYNLAFSDGYGCVTLNSYTDVTMNPAPVCSITGAATGCPGSAVNTFTAPAGMTAYLWAITAGSGTFVGPTNTQTVDVTGGAGCTGTYTLSLTVTDAIGCSKTCTQTVTLEDNAKPTWTTVAGNLDRTVQCSDAAGLAAAQLLVPVASDLCSATLSPVKTSGSFVAGGTCSQAGTYTNTWTVSDVCGNVVDAVFTQTIIVVDNTVPTWTTVAGNLDRSLQCSDAAGLATAQTLTPVASDNCDGTLTPVKTAGAFVSGGTCQAGTYTNTWTVTDDCGNTSVVYTQTITLNDTAVPVWATLPNALDRTVQCGDATGLTDAQTLFPAATDNCDTNVTTLVKVSGSLVAGACANSGTYTNTWTVTDDCGNTSAVFTQVIILQDTTVPVWSTPAGALNVYLECDDAAGLAAAQLQVPVATDNCSATLVPVKTAGVFVAGGAPCTQAGTYSNTWTVTDDCGNVSAVFTQLITLEDNTAPTIIAPPVAVISCSDSSYPSLTGTATATDNCGAAPVITYADALPVAGTCAGNTQIVRTWTATDACGNSSTAPQNIFVQDIFPPVITTQAQNQTVECDGSGNATALNNWLAAHGGAVATDACGTVTWTNNFTALSDLCGVTGAANVTFTATDDCNNSSATLATFTISDTQIPVITCPAAASGTSDQNECFTVNLVLGTATATDNCSTPVVTNNAPAQFPVGVTIVTWTATDVCGNIATCDQTVTIADNSQAPWITCPANVVQTALPNNCELDAVVIPDPTYGDNCAVVAVTWSILDPDNTIRNSAATGINSVSGETFYVGTSTVTYTAADASGHTTSCSFTVWIKDLMKPIFTIGCPADITQAATSGLCTAALIVPVPAVSDPCGEIVSIVNDFNGTSDASGSYPSGITIVTWTITDISGNTNTCAQTITVTDTQLPTISCPADITQTALPNDCFLAAVVVPPPTYADNCGVVLLTWTMSGATTGTSPATGINFVSGQTLNVGLTTVTYEAADASGNSTDCSFVVWIKDQRIPQFTTCPGPITQNADAGTCSAVLANIPAPVVWDPCGEIVSVVNDSPYRTSLTDASGTYPAGVTTITWTITDFSGNINTCTQIITINDTQLPTITCPANFTQTALSGNCALSNVIISDPVTSDNCGIVKQTWVMTGVTTLSSPATGINSVSGQTFNVGITTVTYTVADTTGNLANCSFDVWIKDLVKPVFTSGCPVDVTQSADPGLCTAAVTVPVPPISDPCNESYTVVNSFNSTANASGTYPIGATTVTWTITDASGNINTCTQTVTVTDLLPTLSCPANINQLADFEKDFASNVSVAAPVYSDNCPGLILTWAMTGATIGNSPATGENIVPTPNTFNVGVTTITYTLTDANGHVVTCSFIVTIESKPDISCPAALADFNDPGLCSASLNPGFPTKISGAEPITYDWAMTDATIATGSGPMGMYAFNVGITTITWTATNISGTDVCTQTVTVTDNEPPTFIKPSLNSGYCVEDIFQAVYNPGQENTNLDITYIRPDYYLFGTGFTLLDLSSVADNCALASPAIAWTIDFGNDGSVDLSGTGQLSAYVTAIQFPLGTNRITYTVTDAAGLTSIQFVDLVVVPRPDIIKNF